MSIRTFCAEQSGASRNVVIGAGAGLALVAAAVVGWLNFAPQPEEPAVVEQASAPQDTSPEPIVSSKPTVSAEPDPVAPEPAEETAEAAPAPDLEEPAPEAPTEDVAAEPAAPQPDEDPVAEADPQETVEAAQPEVVAEPAEPEAPANQDAPPVFEVVRVDESGEAVIAGRAEAGRQVRVLLDGVSVAETSADATGAFVALVSLDPSEDPRTLTLESVEEGAEPVQSEETALVAPFAETAEAPTMETAALATPTEPISPDTAEDTPAVSEAAPVITETPEISQSPEAPPSVARDAPEARTSPAAAPQVVIVAPDGAVPQSPSAAPARPDAPDTANVVVDTISYDATGEVILVGRAQAGNFVRLYLDNILAETVPVDSTGGWRSRVTGIDAGVYTLRADETEENGRVVSRFETPFERVTRPRAIAAAEQAAEAEVAAAVAEIAGEESGMRASAGIVTVQPGFTLWAIARENYGDGVQYVRVFEANKSQIRDPDLIYPGQVFSIPEE